MTDVALREFLERMIQDLDRRVDQRFMDLDRRVDQRFDSAVIALAKAESALQEYKTGSNEWRDALKDANNRMATRVELEKLDTAVQILQQAKSNLDGRVAVAAAGISLAVSLLLWLVSRIWR